MSVLLYTLGSIGVIIFVAGAFLAGWLSNPYNMVKLRRSLLKQDFGIAKCLSKDGVTLETKLIDLGQSSFELDNKIWFSKKGFIYRDKRMADGFFFKQVAKTTEEGISCVYLDSTSLKPISLHIPDTKQTPGEMSAWLRTNAQIQVDKGLVKNKQQKQLTILGVIISVIMLLGMVVIYGITASTNETLMVNLAETQNIKMMLETVHGVSIQNGTVAFGGPGG